MSTKRCGQGVAVCDCRMWPKFRKAEFEIDLKSRQLKEISLQLQGLVSLAPKLAKSKINILLSI